jgi:hypothetical protein
MKENWRDFLNTLQTSKKSVSKCSLCRYIKLSSPRLNNIAVVGCILVYTAVILLGLDHATLPTNTHFSAVCTVSTNISI